MINNSNPLPFKMSYNIDIPSYLQETYWWAYIHPKAVKFFEHQWLVNLILLGNFACLRDTVLDEIGETVHGNVLQVACVYGDFSSRLAQRLMSEAHLDIVDVVPIQLSNTYHKIKQYHNVTLCHQNSTALSFTDGHYDNVVVFFLLHEQPIEVRKQTIREALRVTKPGGKLIFVDYHRPGYFNPFRYLILPILHLLEPFALDLWKQEIISWLPEEQQAAEIHKETWFGGLYQKVVITPLPCRNYPEEDK